MRRIRAAEEGEKIWESNNNNKEPCGGVWWCGTSDEDDDVLIIHFFACRTNITTHTRLGCWRKSHNLTTPSEFWMCDQEETKYKFGCVHFSLSAAHKIIKTLTFLTAVQMEMTQKNLELVGTNFCILFSASFPHKRYFKYYITRMVTRLSGAVGNFCMLTCVQ